LPQRTLGQPTGLAEEAVLAAAQVKAGHTIANADAFAIAAAQDYDAVVLTGDPEFESVRELVRVERIQA
jgi:predicted nucleic acid-binding protein